MEKGGIWVIYKGEKYWLSEVARTEFEEFKSKGLNLDYAIEKNSRSVFAPISELELAK